MSRRSLVAAAAAVIVVLTTSPAQGAVSPSGNPDDAASIDELRATDKELTDAIAVLDGEVGAQQKKVESAQQALDAANVALGELEARIATIQADIDVLRGEAADRAVREYMRPNSDNGNMSNPGELGEATRRAAIIRQVGAQQADAIDQLRAARIDLDDQQGEAARARDLADERRGTEQRELDRLNATRAEKQRLDASLQERLKVYAAEDEASLRVGAAGSGRASRSGGDSAEAGRVSGAGLTWPADNRKVNSPFGPRWGRNHNGIDIQASTGNPIYAAKAGTVIQAGQESGYGNFTCIDHGGGFSTCYAHQSRIAVSKGQAVQTGQYIGAAGNTGASQAPHLHFETHVNGKPVNPLNYL